MVPKLSIVISAYNNERDIERSLDSLLCQSYENYELIIINDGSSDSTSDILYRYAKADPRLRIIHQENQGLTRALIRGCNEASGTFIARQDADDWSVSDRLKIQLELIESDPEIGFVSCATRYVGPENEPLEVISRPTDSRLATDQLLNQKHGPPAHGSVLFRKSVYDQIGGYRPEFYYGQDSDLWLRMGEVSRIAYLKDVLYYARRDFQSISGGQRITQHEFGRLANEMRQARKNQTSEANLLAEARNITDEILARKKKNSEMRKEQGIAEERPVEESTNDASRNEMAYLLGSQLAQLRDRRGLKYLWNVVKKSPLHYRAWGRIVQLLVFGRFASSETGDPLDHYKATVTKTD